MWRGSCSPAATWERRPAGRSSRRDLAGGGSHGGGGGAPSPPSLPPSQIWPEGGGRRQRWSQRWRRALSTVARAHVLRQARAATTSRLSSKVHLASCSCRYRSSHVSCCNAILLGWIGVLSWIPLLILFGWIRVQFDNSKFSLSYSRTNWKFGNGLAAERLGFFFFLEQTVYAIFFLI